MGLNIKVKLLYAIAERLFIRSVLAIGYCGSMGQGLLWSCWIRKLNAQILIGMT